MSDVDTALEPLPRDGDMPRSWRNYFESGRRRNGEVISGINTLNSQVQVIQGQITDIDGSLSTYYGISVDGGGNGAILRLSDGASVGSAIVLSADDITLNADAINFGSQTEFDTTTETFRTDLGTLRAVLGLAPFGTTSNLLRWIGLASVADGDETTANGVYTEDTSGIVRISGNPLSWGATAAEAAASNALVKVGGNLLVDSAFARGTTFWAATGFNNTGLTLSAGTNLGGPYFNASRNVYYGTVTGVPANGSVFSFAETPLAARFSVLPGERLYGRFLGAVYRATNVYMILVWWNPDGTNTVTSTDIAITTFSDGSAALNGVTFGLAEGYATVPAGVTGVSVLFRVTCNGGTNPYGFVAEPMIARVDADQTATGIPYVPGRTDPLADPTATNTAAAITGQGALATRNDVGTTQIASGAVSNVSVVFTAGTASYNSTSYVTVQSFSVTKSDGTLIISASALFYLLSGFGSTSDASVRVVRGGTVIYDSPVFLIDGGGYGATSTWCIVITDTPAAGTYTYEIQALCTSATSIANVSNRTICVTELKR